MIIKTVLVGPHKMDRSIYRDSPSEDRYSDAGNNVCLSRNPHSKMWLVTSRGPGNSCDFHSGHRIEARGIAAMAKRIRAYYS